MMRAMRRGSGTDTRWSLRRADLSGAHDAAGFAEPSSALRAPSPGGEGKPSRRQIEQQHVAALANAAQRQRGVLGDEAQRIAGRKAAPVQHDVAGGHMQPVPARRRERHGDAIVRQQPGRAQRRLLADGDGAVGATQK